MGIKLSQLEQRDVRAVVSVEGLGDVTITNPKGALKVELLEFVQSKMGKQGVQIDQNEVVSKFMANLTDIEIDLEDVSNILDCGTTELTKIMFHLTSIVQELTYEILCQQNLQLQMVEKALLAADSLAVSENIETLAKSLKKPKEMKNTKKK